MMETQHHDIARLTRQYARFARSAGGLGSAFGGLLVLAAWTIGAVATTARLEVRLTLAVTPLLWIAVNELLRRHYYQRLGRVEELWPDNDRRLHVGLTAFTAAVSLVVLGFVIWRWIGGVSASPGTIGYAALIAAMPVLVWFFMRAPLEYIVGVFLVCQAALMLAGSHYSLGEQLQAPLAAVVLIVVGIMQHARFLRLRRELGF